MIEKLKRFVSEFSIVKDQDLPILHEFLEWAKNRVDYERSSEFIEAEKIRIHNEVGVLIDKLNRSRIINNFENHKLLNYIYINNQVNNYVPYFWERGMKEPRIQWLKEQIEKLENENKN